MKDKIEAKVNEVIDYIISKDVKDITYNEYRILDSKLSNLKYEEEARKRNDEMTSLLVKSIGNYSNMPSTLPDIKED